MTDIEPCRAFDCRTPPTDGYADRGLCDACERRAFNAVTGLPATFRSLLPLIRERRARGLTGMPAAGKPGPQVPLNVDVEELAGEIKYVAVQWAEIIRERAGLPEHPRETVESACVVLAAWWTALLAAPHTAVAAYDRTIDGIDGVDAIGTMIRLHRRAHYIIGLDPRLVHLPGICPGEGCGRPWLRHLDGGAVVWCGNCHRTWSWTEYAAYVELVTVGQVTGG